MTETQPKREPDGEIPTTTTPSGDAMRGVTQLLNPCIMKCSSGGYMVLIPGVGLMAATTMDEIVKFIADNADRHFHPGLDVPKVVREATAKTFSMVRRTDPVMAGVICGLAVLIAGFAFWRKSEAPPVQSSTIVREVPVIKVIPPQ